MLAKIEGRRRGQQRMRWLNSIIDLMDLNLNNFLEFSCGRTSAIWLLFSNFGVAHPAGVWFDFIMIVFFISSHCGLYFVFGCKISFLVGSSLLFLMVVQHSVVILLLLLLFWEGMSQCLSTLPFCPVSSLFLYKWMFSTNISIYIYRRTKKKPLNSYEIN